MNVILQEHIGAIENLFIFWLVEIRQSKNTYILVLVLKILGYFLRWRNNNNFKKIKK